MIAPLVSPRQAFAELERAPCPGRFQARWRNTWTSTPWQGRVYKGHAPAVPQDRAHLGRLYDAVSRWHDPAALGTLLALLKQGGLTHTPRAADSPWGRLLHAIPLPLPVAPAAAWERMAQAMMDHGASVNEVAYPWLQGEVTPVRAPVMSLEDEIEVASPTNGWRLAPQAAAKPLRGLVMAVGATGSGKSTMMAALMRQVNHHPCANPLAQAAASGNAMLANWLLNQGADPLWASPFQDQPETPDLESPHALRPFRWALPFMLAEHHGHTELADHLEARTLAAAERYHLQQLSLSTTALAPTTARSRL